MTSHSRSSAFGASILPQRRRSLILRLLDTLGLMRQRRDLATLDDALLEDLGLTREAAEAEARRAAWDVPAHWRG